MQNAKADDFERRITMQDGMKIPMPDFIDLCISL